MDGLMDSFVCCCTVLLCIGSFILCPVEHSRGIRCVPSERGGLDCLFRASSLLGEGSGNGHSPQGARNKSDADGDDTKQCRRRMDGWMDKPFDGSLRRIEPDLDSLRLSWNAGMTYSLLVRTIFVAFVVVSDPSQNCVKFPSFPCCVGCSATVILTVVRFVLHRQESTTLFRFRRGVLCFVLSFLCLSLAVEGNDRVDCRRGHRGRPCQFPSE
jgi:hypothetical protein